MGEQFDQQADNGTGGNSTNREEQYKMLQAGYTKQAQQKAQLEKELEEARKQTQMSNGDDGEARKQRIKDNVLEPELQKLKSTIVEEQKFSELIDYNPSLKPFEQAIKTLATTEGLSYEDVIENYGFASKDKLAKAKDRVLVGDRTLETQPKSVDNLSEAERKTFESQYKGVGAYDSVSSF